MILLSAAVGTLVGLTMIVLGGPIAAHADTVRPLSRGAGWIALLWGDPLVELYERMLF